MTFEKQIEILKKGAVEIIPENGLQEKLEKAKKENRPLIIKLGADPSAPDIHLGHTVPLRKLKHFQDLGHQIQFLIGDFTGMIGDPTGKSTTRKQLTKEQVLENAESYKKQIFKILDPEKTQIVFNSEWLSPMNFEDVLKLTSKYTVARMLERDDFSKRYKSGTPISLVEFMYPLIQGYDSVAMKADIEIGGTDQKFNLLVGRDLQREYGQEPQVIITLPLLEGTDGVNKMSKSLGNYIGIDEKPFDIFGKIMSINDEIMWKYFELATEISVSEIEEMKVKVSQGENPKNLKIKLAKNIVAQFYSEEEALKCEKEFEEVFSKKNTIPDDTPEIILEKAVLIIDLIVEHRLADSKSEAKRLIQQGAVSFENNKISALDFLLQPADGILKVGKRRFLKIKKG
ncbi:MAG TPA: tyrosine--tRNA ligase [Spirochaetia bacterium]|nr:MAG: tyrosine--tRNA ligase [Spirochaetes bacterium GWB1_36_13]HCL56647.1 tyrosine--tRNA ligase [Spirochaetia bacterium]